MSIVIDDRYSNMLTHLRNVFYKPAALPVTAADIGDYRDTFREALQFTTSCGFPMEKLRWAAGDALDAGGDFAEPALRAGGVIDLSLSAGQCLKWSHYLAPAFEQQIGRRVWTTIGQLWSGDKALFSPSWADLRRWARTGISLAELRKDGRRGVNLHAWLTVETGEIIDLTLPSSLAAAKGPAFAGVNGALVWGRDPRVLNGYRYFPMAAGPAIVEAIGAGSEMPLLATNQAELHTLMGVVTR